MRDYLPIVHPDASDWTSGTDAGDLKFRHPNTVPKVVEGNRVGFTCRPEFTNTDFSLNGSGARGRGLFAVGVYFVILTEDSWEFRGAASTSTSMTGGTGFNEEYIGKFLLTDISGTQSLIVVNAGHTSTNASANHGNVYYSNDIGYDGDDPAAPSRITNANMPGNNGTSIIRGGVVLDGFLFLADINGQIHNSNLNDITTWDAGDFLTAERKPDVGVYLGKHSDHLVYFGTQSIEFFYNAGNPTNSPLANRQDVFYNVGTTTPNAFYEGEDSIFFVGRDEFGAYHVYQLTNFQLTIISPPWLDSILTDEVDDKPPELSIGLDNLVEEVYLSNYVMRSQTGLVLTVSDAGTFYYDNATKQWVNWWIGSTPTNSGKISDWTYVAPIIGTQVNGAESSFIQFANNQFATLTDTPGSTAYNDLALSNAITPYVDFTPWSGGTFSRKRVDQVRVVNRPFSDSSFEPSNGTLRWLDYDNPTATGPQSYSLANFNTGVTVNINKPSVTARRGGKTRERKYVFEFTNQKNFGPVVEGLAIDFEVIRD